MKAKFTLSIWAAATIATNGVDPVIDFKTNLTIEPSDKILKWQADINGDSHNEVFLSLKSSLDEDKNQSDSSLSSWDFYFSNADGSTYTKPEGIENTPDSISIDDTPLIDLDACYIGQIDELGKRGIVTKRHKSHHPVDGRTIILFAYTLEGDHLKKHQLTQFEDGEENPIFSKYLAEDKKTVPTVIEMNP